MHVKYCKLMEDRACTIKKSCATYDVQNYPGKRPETVCVRSRGVAAESLEI